MQAQPRVAHVATVDLTARFLLFGQLQRFREEGYDVTVITTPGPWTAELEGAGIRHIGWRHATRAWHPLRDLRAAGELDGIFRRERFDLVHTHTPKAGVIGRIVARRADVPYVLNTVHGYFATPDDPPARRIPVREVERLAARSSDLELFQSEEDLRWALRERIVRPAQAVYLGNGTDLRMLDPASVEPGAVDALRQQLGIPRSAVVVGTIGRVVAEKGYRELIGAARIVRSRNPDVRVVAIGDVDAEKTDRLGRSEIEDASGDVIFAGWRTDIPTVLALFDVFVLASWREGMPRSAIEAAAMARPLVVTDIRGCREIVRDGIEGLIVPPRDPAALADAIHRLVVDPARRQDLGAAARARAVDRFDERRVFDRIVEAYGTLLPPPSAATSMAATDRATIRRARSSDARRLARIHRRTLGGAFLPVLGERFLAELYRAAADDPEAVVCIAERNGTTVGFAAGVRSVPRFYRRFLLRHGLRAAIAVVPRALRPDVLRRIVETARYPISTSDLPEAELLSICVEPGSRRNGIGRRLAARVMDGLSELGADEVKVVVDAENAAANRLYGSLGFLAERSIRIHRGTTSTVWVIECRSSSRSRSLSS
jgi:glycosyltransferase involved in cell wall biosynthesis/ribosomal protein S18 acetylase RimI-like enzyme